MNVKKFYANLPLPKCAVQIDGEYLERTIPGYRTASVSGRESLSVSVSTKQVGITDGEVYQYKKNNAKQISISFALVGGSINERNNSINQLKKILSGEEMKLVFRDESNVYYIGTVTDIDISTINSAGCNYYAVAGTISVYVSSGKKFSIDVKEAVPTLDNGYTFGIDYGGNKEYHPSFEITMTGDNGYVGILDQNGHILEFGNVDEEDGTIKQRNENLATITNFFNAKDDTSGKDYLHPTYGVKGTLSTATWYNKKFLKLGTAGEKVGIANGGQRTITIPADSLGNFGSKNFYSYLHFIFVTTIMGQTGEIVVNYLTNDNKVIAGICLYKVDSTGNTGHYEISSNGTCYRTFDYVTTNNKNQNPWSSDSGVAELRKEGSKLTFYYNGSSYSYTNPSIENFVCTKVQISIKEYNQRTGDKFISYCGIDEFKFTKLNADYMMDSPNLFSNGDKLKIDCSNGTITLNGVSKPGLGKIANDWENFKLVPGINQIKIVCSSWANKPDMKIKYREAFS